MAKHFLPPYGGPGFTLRDDGRIDVDGLGTIVRKWSKTVDRWRSLITRAASRRDVPEAWIAGVMLQESGGQQTALSPSGCIGLMQICEIPSTWGEHPTRQQIYEPAYNIDLGAHLLNTLASKSGWNIVSTLAKYNAGGVYPYTGKNCPHPDMWGLNTNCDYVPQCVRGINAAIDNGYSGTGASELSSSGKVVAGSMIAIATVATSLYLLNRKR